MKTVKKIVVMYSDGTYEELEGNRTFVDNRIDGGTITINSTTPTSNGHFTDNAPLSTNPLRKPYYWARHFSDWE